MATAKNQGGKGNPAQHRIGNERRKQRRKDSWLRGQQRKEANRRANEERAAHNRQLREQGLPTPHEAQRAKRKAVRDQLRAEGKLPPLGTTRAQWEREKRKAKA